MLEITCYERPSVEVSFSSRLLQMALKQCIHLRYPEFSSELPAEACRALSGVMAELPDNLRLQTFIFGVCRSSGPIDADELYEKPYPYFYDAICLLLERCPELRHIYLYSDNVDNVNEVEFSNMVLRHCPQLASFRYDRYTHSILGFPMLAKRITSRDTCIIARSKHVNGFLPILQHLRDNLANTKRVGRFPTIKTLALDRKLQNQ